MSNAPATAPIATPRAEPARGFGIYVHWPFCVSKCPYCDFNSHVRARIDEEGWRAALLSELDHFAAATRGRTVTSVFFGGGTPSLMAPATAQAVIERIARNWSLPRDAEITLEANPNSAERARFADFQSAGINRLSIGVQALDDVALKMLGRAHDQSEARAAIAAASVFTRYSFDLIYARPGQSVAAWRRELREALLLAGDHLSLYQLTIEPGTAFHAQHARGDLRVPDEAVGEALYDVTQELLEAAGLPAYEVSNHARPGGACRHNLVYWRYEDYVGVGPGAHGRLTLDGVKTATRQEKLPETWLARVREAGHGTAERIAVLRREAAAEALLMGLRLTEGIDEARFARETGHALDDVLDAARLQRLLDGGFIVRSESGLRVTPAGRKVLNAVLGALIA
ncbi:MAG TPA: radical SAM family heme chaperone HemW [Alphaproteobacteria bacterium]|nr:radical SAM family heme chaperone HemW [Alphaproteobacteria bacterium]